VLGQGKWQAGPAGLAVFLGDKMLVPALTRQFKTATDNHVCYEGKVG